MSPQDDRAVPAPCFHPVVNAEDVLCEALLARVASGVGITCGAPGPPVRRSFKVHNSFPRSRAAHRPQTPWTINGQPPPPPRRFAATLTPVVNRQDMKATIAHHLWKSFVGMIAINFEPIKLFILRKGSLQNKETLIPLPPSPLDARLSSCTSSKQISK